MKQKYEFNDDELLMLKRVDALLERLSKICTKKVEVYTSNEFDIDDYIGGQFFFGNNFKLGIDVSVNDISSPELQLSAYISIGDDSDDLGTPYVSPDAYTFEKLQIYILDGLDKIKNEPEASAYIDQIKSIIGE